MHRFWLFLDRMNSHDYYAWPKKPGGMVKFAEKKSVELGFMDSFLTVPDVINAGGLTYRQLLQKG